jgi:DNA-binding beta-propeller fold protein YncE
VGGLAAMSSDIRQIALDPDNGDLYVADAGNAAIRKIDKQTGIISTVAGIGLQGYTGTCIFT